LPEDITVVEAMPRTPTGKIDRNALRQRLAQKEGQQDD
jgi:acyl-coenzyme A synthetase/AMP-(fatty) acid ligase